MIESQPTFTACPACGAALHRDERDEHVCDDERQLEFGLRAELAAFDAELETWLGSSRGRFAVWLAEHARA